MEKLIYQIERFAKRKNMTPEAVLREVIGANWGQWQDWKSGKSSPTVKNADRIYAHISTHSIPTDEDTA